MFSVETVDPATRTALCLDKTAAVREVSAEDEDVPQEGTHKVRHGDTTPIDSSELALVTLR